MAFLDSPALLRPSRTVAVDWSAVLLAGLGAVAALGLVRAAVAIGVPHPYGNEGWNAFHAAAAMAGEGPYPSAGSLVANNYPPLSFYLVGVLGRLIGDMILAGRLVSLVSFLAITAACGQAVRLLGGNTKQALFAALIFASFLLFDSDYVGVDDPQLLGQAFEMGGLLVLLFARGRMGRLVLAAGLMAAGFFTKHNLIALPLASGLWLLWTDRKAGLRFAAFGLGFALAGLGLFALAFHRSLWSVLACPRVWLLRLALNGFGGRLPELILPVAATAWGVRFQPSPALRFAAIYLALSLVLGFWFGGGAGCSGNVLFDGMVALAVCGGLVPGRLMGRAREAAMACWVFSVAGMLAFHAATGSFKPRYWLSPMDPAVTDTAQDIAFLKARPGAVLTKDLALAYWAGKPAGVDLWAYLQGVTTGASDGRALLDAIAAQRFSVLQLGAPPNAGDVPSEVRRDYAGVVNVVIAAHYRIDHSDTTGTYWVPKPAR